MFSDLPSFSCRVIVGSLQVGSVIQYCIQAASCFMILMDSEKDYILAFLVQNCYKRHHERIQSWRRRWKQNCWSCGYKIHCLFTFRMLCIETGPLRSIQRLSNFVIWYSFGIVNVDNMSCFWYWNVQYCIQGPSILYRGLCSLIMCVIDTVLAGFQRVSWYCSAWGIESL